MLHHFVCWYVKCVEKVPFRKSGHIYYINIIRIMAYLFYFVISFSINKHHCWVIYNVYIVQYNRPIQ